MGWKKSQSNSGFYKKEKGKLPEFIWIERSELDGKNYFTVMQKEGIGDRDSRVVGYYRQRKDAQNAMAEYMENYP